jgi:hypothetical protein
VLGQPDEPAAGEVSRPVTEALRAELDRAGQADSVLGRAALGLAQRIDASVVDTGSSYAALQRELRATLEVLAGQLQPASAVDELRARREARLRGGA